MTLDEYIILHLDRCLLILGVEVSPLGSPNTAVSYVSVLSAVSFM